MAETLGVGDSLFVRKKISQSSTSRHINIFIREKSPDPRGQDSARMVLYYVDDDVL